MSGHSRIVAAAADDDVAAAPVAVIVVAGSVHLASAIWRLSSIRMRIMPAPGASALPLLRPCTALCPVPRVPFVGAANQPPEATIANWAPFCSATAAAGTTTTRVMAKKNLIICFHLSAPKAGINKGADPTTFMRLFAHIFNAISLHHALHYCRARKYATVIGKRRRFVI